nr:uncharacterized protein LOC103348030 isoform X5 [Oryctolagus cuniculus]
MPTSETRENESGARPRTARQARHGTRPPPHGASGPRRRTAPGQVIRSPWKPDGGGWGGAMETGAERGGLSSGVPRVTNVWPPAPPTVGGARLPSEDAQSALCGPVALCSRRPRDPLTACVPPPAVTWLASNTKSRGEGMNTLVGAITASIILYAKVDLSVPAPLTHSEHWAEITSRQHMPWALMML